MYIPELNLEGVDMMYAEGLIMYATEVIVRGSARVGGVRRLTFDSSGCGILCSAQAMYQKP